jgi:hypothetical protein
VAAPERWSLGFGLGFAFGLSDVQQQESDVIEGRNLAFTELTLAPSYRLTPSVARGIQASWGFQLGERGIASNSGESVEEGWALWQLALAGRYQREAGRGWYVAADAGAAALVDSIGGDSVAQWAQRDRELAAVMGRGPR